MANGDSDLPKTPTLVRFGDLSTVAGVRRELVSLYRAARRTAGSDITPADASKLGHLLGNLYRTMELSQIEARITEIERLLADKASP
jgi:hypothetical protein